MFHVFPAPDKATPEARPAPRREEDRKTKTPLTRSCAECRRRRIKCDSAGPPCGQCRWYKVQNDCHFPNRRQRNVPSLRSHNEVKSVAEKSSKILKTLFPTQSLDELSGLSRDELLRLLQREPNEESRNPAQDTSEEELNCIELSPQQDFQWDETAEKPNPTANVSDDVNGLSLALDNKSSYLGISSISAIIRIMVQIAPGARTWIMQSASQPPVLYQEGPKTVKDALVGDEMRCIDAYFTYIHNGNPLVNEQQFRTKYLQGPHSDSPWTALLNMILTMGSIAASSAKNHAHFVFYQRAYPHLSLENLGAGQLETVQALTILGGAYLHYLNKPNLASVITGAALRMAVALGLHREPLPSSSTVSEETRILLETRRRTWWSLFCYDTWASTTLGRPSLGRWDPHCVTAQLPQRLSEKDFAAICLRTSADFCKIGTAIQDRFARAPLITSREILDFDARLLKWKTRIPSELCAGDTIVENLRAAAGLIRARYLNLRLVLFRPRLLVSVLRREAQGLLQLEEEQVIRTCRDIAHETLQEISKSWFKNQISAWNGVWVLFQATMIPLLCLFSDPSHEDVPTWKGNVQEAISLFEQMDGLSLAASRSREVVCKIYEASQRVGEIQAGGVGLAETQDLLLLSDEHTWSFNEDIDWLSSFPEFSDVNFDMDFLGGPSDPSFG